MSGAGSKPAGRRAWAYARPADHWVFTGWSGDATTTKQLVSVLMNGPKSITATFAHTCDIPGFRCVGMHPGAGAQPPRQPAGERRSAPP